MPKSISPIPTIYRGHHFRSRLEARWAVFFDLIDIPWSYEDEGFDLDGTRYLPDFWLPNVRIHLNTEPGIFFEVKGVAPYGDKPERLAAASGRDVFVAVGTLPDGEIEKYFGDSPGWDCPHLWGRCQRCREWTIQYQDYTERHCGGFTDDYHVVRNETQALLDKAAKHRFWDPS